jgi:Domain of unknown function (DUF3943)
MLPADETTHRHRLRCGLRSTREARTDDESAHTAPGTPIVPVIPLVLAVHHARLRLRRLAHVGRQFALGILCSVCFCLPAVAENAIGVDGGTLPATQPDGSTPSITVESEPTVEPASTMQQDTAEQPAGYRWRGPAPARPDWQGLRRDAGYFLAYQFVAIGVLYVAPESFSGWTEEQKHNFKWRENVSHPVWDTDAWYVNYILHPYWGGTYYVRGRERGLDQGYSFLYSALLSTLYEYGAEALFEPVSAQDLFVTPIIGSLVGEFLFMPWRAQIRAKSGELDWTDKAVLLLTDPLGVANAQIEGLLGVKTTLQFQPSGMRPPAPARDHATASLAGPSQRARTGWRLQLRFDL